jgi:hypothetical protein
MHPPASAFFLDCWTLENEIKSCPVTLVTNYQATPYNIPEEQRP